MNQSEIIYRTLEQRAVNRGRALPRLGQDRRLESRLSKDGKYGEIKLTKGKFCKVDLEDFVRVNNFSWFTNESCKTFYAIKFIRIKNKKHKISMARWIIRCPDGLQVDHINGDGLDNRKCNLRICTCSQNQANRRLKITNKTGFIGVYFRKSKNMFEVGIKHNSHLKHLGSFKDPREAARAYDKAAFRIHGEFAALNFPKRLDRLAKL